MHDEAPSAEETDWPQIVALYEVLLQISDNPMVALNHAVAVAMVDGPEAGLDLLSTLAGDSRIADDHRLHAVRAHLLELAGDHRRAREAYEAAARRTTSVPQQRYLRTRAARLVSEGGAAPGACRRAGERVLRQLRGPCPEARGRCPEAQGTCPVPAVGLDL